MSPGGRALAVVPHLERRELQQDAGVEPHPFPVQARPEVTAGEGFVYRSGGGVRCDGEVTRARTKGKRGGGKLVCSR